MANDGGGRGGDKLSGRGKSQKLSPCSTGTRNSDWGFGKARSEGEEKIIYCTAAAMFMVQYSTDSIRTGRISRNVVSSPSSLFFFCAETADFQHSKNTQRQKQNPRTCSQQYRTHVRKIKKKTIFSVPRIVIPPNPGLRKRKRRPTASPTSGPFFLHCPKIPLLMLLFSNSFLVASHRPSPPPPLAQ